MCTPNGRTPTTHKRRIYTTLCGTVGRTDTYDTLKRPENDRDFHKREEGALEVSSRLLCFLCPRNLGRIGSSVSVGETRVGAESGESNETQYRGIRKGSNVNSVGL